AAKRTVAIEPDLVSRQEDVLRSVVMHRNQEVSSRQIADVDSRLEVVKLIRSRRSSLRGRDSIAIDVLVRRIDFGVHLSRQYDFEPVRSQSFGELERVVEREVLFLKLDSPVDDAHVAEIFAAVSRIDTDDVPPILSIE